MSGAGEAAHSNEGPGSAADRTKKLLGFAWGVLDKGSNVS